MPATLETTGPAHPNFTERVRHTQWGVGPGEHSGNPSVQHPIMMSFFDQPNQNLTNDIKI
jgi:hypothetical protein